MVSFTIKKRLEAPPERIFEVCTDLRNAGKHLRGIKKPEVLGDGPIGVGTRFRETRILVAGRTHRDPVIRCYGRGCDLPEHALPAQRQSGQVRACSG